MSIKINDWYKVNTNADNFGHVVGVDDKEFIIAVLFIGNENNKDYIGYVRQESTIKTYGIPKQYHKSNIGLFYVNDSELIKRSGKTLCKNCNKR